MATGKYPLGNNFILLVGLLGTIVAGARVWESPSPPEYPEALAVHQVVAASERYLSDGDIVFRRGRDITSDLVMSAGQDSRFSHAGVIVRRPAGVHVIHSTPPELGSLGGVVVETLAEFAAPKQAADIGFARVKGISQKGREKIAKFAHGQIGKPFDTELLFSTPEKIYCTELVVKAIGNAMPEGHAGFKSIRVPVIPEEVFTPDDLSRSRLLVAVNSPSN